MKTSSMRVGLLILLLQAAMAVTLLAPSVIHAKPTAGVRVMEHCLTSTMDCLPCATCPLAPGYTPATAHGSDAPVAPASGVLADTPRVDASPAWAWSSAAPSLVRIHLLYCRWLN